jgi:hypothetical protein
MEARHSRSAGRRPSVDVVLGVPLPPAMEAIRKVTTRRWLHV